MTIILAAAVIILLMVAAGLAIRLSLYRKQILHMKEELMMIQKEDTNYRLSSYCHIGETEEVITALPVAAPPYTMLMAATSLSA